MLLTGLPLFEALTIAAGAATLYRLQWKSIMAIAPIVWAWRTNQKNWLGESYQPNTSKVAVPARKVPLNN